MKIAKLYLIEGRVQGVGFRFFVQRVASDLGLRGTVRNLADGRVEVYAMGEEEALTQLRSQLETGPRLSRVEKIEEREAPLQKHNEFSIEAGF